MSEEKDWQELDKQTDEDLSALLQLSTITKLKSTAPLQKLKRSLRNNMLWATLISCLYIPVLVIFPYWQVRTALGILLVFSIWGIYTAFVQYKRITAESDPGTPVLQELKRHYQSINAWNQMLQRVSIFIYPISTAGGFMLGGAIGSGKPISFLLGKPLIVVVMIILMILLTPAAYYLTKWMCKVAFGKHLDDLKKNIDDLEGGE